jgi:hypothetical protein
MSGIRSRPKNRTGERTGKLLQTVLRYPYRIPRLAALRRSRPTAFCHAECNPFGFEGFQRIGSLPGALTTNRLTAKHVPAPLISLMFLNIFVTGTGLVCKL